VFTPDGKYVISVSDDRTLVVWDVATGKPVHTSSKHQAEIQSLAISPDGKMALSGSRDNTMILWDTKTWVVIRIFQRLTDEIRSVSFSPDGKYAVSGSGDKSVILWDIHTGAPLYRYTGHALWVQGVQFCSNNHILSTSQDQTARVWSAFPPDDLVEWTLNNRSVRELTCEERTLYDVKPLCR
jgi:WD40 repeat protein